tara:strand:- start:52 stop:957 length:906 start_codon:yes stop_codon:yes gene_type:complete
MSKLEVDAIEPQSGTTLTIGASGDVVNIASGATITDFTSTGIDDNATSTAITIDSSEQVGIGETSPLGKLHVKTGDSGASASTIADELVIESSGSGGLNILTGSGGNAQIDFGDSADNNIGRIQYNHSDNSLRTTVNAAEAMRITSAGHVIAPNLNTTGSTSNRYPLYWVHSGTVGSMEPYTGSIRAMKTDINNMSSVNWIHSLTPRSFKFRDYETDEDGNKVYLETTNNLPNTEYGLIAEEVNEVNGSDYILDKQIDEDGNENLKGVLYHNLVPVLLKAVQEQQTKIQELEARITTLENN